MGLRFTASALYLLLRGVLIAPPQVFFYRTAEQQIGLKHHCHAVAQCMELILPDIPSAYADTAIQHVIEPRYQLDESCLGRTCASDYAYSLAGFDLKADICQSKVIGIFAVREADMIEFHAAVENGGIIDNTTVIYVYFLIQDLHDTFLRSLCHNKACENRRQHHDA